MSNMVVDCIHARRSTRKYSPEQIKDEHLEMLLDAAIWAPSGGNNQSWLFTAIQNKDILIKLNDLVREGFKVWTPDDDYPGKHAAKKRATENEGFTFCYHAPTLIIASNKPNYENAMADCSLAMQNIFLTAQSIGLGSCYINHMHWLRNDKNIRDFLFELGIPKEHTICNCAAIGYIEKESTAPARKENTIIVIK